MSSEEKVYNDSMKNYIAGIDNTISMLESQNEFRKQEIVFNKKQIALCNKSKKAALKNLSTSTK